MSNAKSSRLPNGIVVLSENIPNAHGVGISILADVSPQDETESQSGLAHLCEHAFFLGTSTRSETEVGRLIDTAGGQLGGFTARDYTCLHATISAEYTTYAIDLLGDLLTNSLFDETRLRNEIDVIGHEIDAHQDTAETWLDSELKRLIWAGDPLGRSILGSKTSLSSIGQREVRHFVKEHYTPDRLVFAAAGQIDHDDLVEQVNDAMWQMEGSDCRENRTEAATVSGGLVVEHRDQRLANISVLVPAPVYSDPDRYALHILVALLGGGMSSRLYGEIRENLGLAYTVGACLNAYGRGSVINIELSTTPNSVMQAVSGVFGQLVELAFDESSISEEEFWKAKMQVKGQAFLASDSIPTRVSRLVTQQHYFGAPIPIADLTSAIESVDHLAVRDIARRVLSTGLGSTSVGVVGNIRSFESQLRSDLNDLRKCFTSNARQSCPA